MARTVATIRFASPNGGGEEERARMEVVVPPGETLDSFRDWWLSRLHPYYPWLMSYAVDFVVETEQNWNLAPDEEPIIVPNFS